ncbi:tyrosine-type recombinase/integrase [Campylobacterota bacterium]
MNTAETIVFQEESRVTEVKSFLQYTSSVTEDIPDKWDVSKYDKRPDNTITIDFTWANRDIRMACKYWAWTLIFRQDFQPASVNSMVSHAAFFFEFARSIHGLNKVKDNFYYAWMAYIDDLRLRVKSSLVEGSKKPLQPRTASQYASNALMFMAQLGSMYKGFEWVFRRDYSVLLPHDISSYLTGDERHTFKQKLVRLQFENKTQVIPYDELLILTRALEGCDDIYLKNAVKVALHTGLRITEVLILKKGCLAPVSKEEIEAATAYRQKHKIGLGGVDPNWSEMYWLAGHQVVKDKKTAEWSTGTPIMVSKVVYDALKELEEFTSRLREESGLDYLFINKHRGRIRVRSYSALQQSKQKFIKNGRLPYFRFHQTRATFATILYDLGIPEEMIKKYLNHVNIETTSGYVSSNHEREYMEMNAVAAGRLLGISVNNKKVDSFVREITGVVTASEWEHLDYFDQLAVYASIKRKNNLSVVYYDHGFCMLGLGESCQYGYGDVKPCYLSDCSKFEPDKEELPSFAEMLREREKVRPELKKLYDGQAKASPEYTADLRSRMKEFEDDTLSLLGLVEQLKLESKGA